MAAPKRTTMAPKAAFIFFFLFAGALASDKCTAGCQGGSEPKNGFQAGNTYSYWLEGVSHVRLSGADQQETAIRISAMATVVALGNCANILKITSLQITSPDGLKYNKVQDIERPVRFTLQDGVLGSDICAEEGDSEFSLNIKRAILSLLQTANKFNTEVDVFGVCPTSFNVQNDGANSKSVHKSKNLNACAYREHGKNDLIAYIYNPNAKLKDSNIMHSQLKSDAIVRNGIVEKVETQEEYLYRPFSVGNDGATASVNTKLTLKETNKGTLQAKCVVPKSIIFENPQPVNTPHSNLNNAAQTLNHAVKVLNNKVEPKSATVFGTLVKVFRVTSRDDLLSLYGQVQAGAVGKDNKDLAKRVFLDALFRTGTGDSTEVVIKLLQNKELTPMQKKLALIFLTTVKHATPASIKAATGLLNDKDLPKEVFIGVGALAGSYCKRSSCHSPSHVPEVKELSAKLLSLLGNGKAASKKDENTIIAVLKGIRNIHHLEDALVEKLAAIATDKNVKQRVRVAAFETFAADPCVQKLQNIALKVLKDYNEDSEIRIKAYLSLLECPNTKVAGELKSILDNEPVNQVGSFITSSLRNIRNSANPSRLAAKQYFGSISTHKKFPLDGRKFSQNYELSYDFNTLGSGAIADANVIFSQNSFLPRSASLNLTTEIFGRTINFIEVGARQGNLDRVMEEFLGPYGSFASNTPQQIYEHLKKTAASISDKINEKTGRPKRDVKKETDTFGKKLKTDIPGYNENLDLDIFIRLFGSDALFLTLGDDKPFDLNELIDRVFNNIDDGVNKAQQFSYVLRSHMPIVDVALNYPTSNGLTMKIEVDAYATSKVEFGGSINLKNIFTDIKNAKIDINLVPSANIEASGIISFDADVISTGLKVVTALHTSTGAHVIAKLEEKGFDVQLGLPIEKQEILTATNDIYFFTREKGKEDTDKELKFNTDSWKKFSDCFDQFSNAIGLSVCGDVFVPWAQENKKPATLLPFPLGGPVKVGLRLEKDNLDGFHIRGHVTESGEGQALLEVSVEAQGSKKRKVSWQLEKINRPDLVSLKTKLISSVKQLEAYATLNKGDKEKSVSVGFKHDEEDYYAKVGLSSTNPNDKTVVFKPILEYKIPKLEGEQPKLQGTIKMTTTPNVREYVFDKLSLVYQENVLVLEGKLVASPNHHTVDLKLSNKDKKATIKGKFDRKESASSAKLEFLNNIENNVNFVFEGDATYTKDFRSVDVVLVHGADPNSATNKIKYSASLKGVVPKASEFNWETVNFHYKNQLSYPLPDIEFKTDLAVAPKNFDFEFDGKYGEQKLEVETEFKCGMKTAQDFLAKVEFKVNDKGVDSKLNFAGTGDDKGTFDGSLKIMNSPVYEVQGTVSNKMEENNVDLALNAELKAKTKEGDKIYKLDVHCAKNPTKHSSGLKVSKGADELVDYQFNYVPGQHGDLKFAVKNFVSGNGQFKNEGADSKNKGDIVLVVSFVKPDRKIKVDTKYSVADSVCNVNMDIFPDFEHNNNNKITFTTNTKYVNDENRVIDSKNTAKFGENLVELDLKNELLTKDGQTKSARAFKIALPKGTLVSLESNYDHNIKKEGEDNVHNIAVSRLIKFKLNNAQKLYTLNQKTLYKNVNIDDQVGAIEESIGFNKEGGENLDLKYNVNAKNVDKRKFVDMKGSVAGSLLPNPGSVDVSLDFLRDDDDQVDINYKAKATYGQNTKLDAKGKYVFTDFIDRDDKWSNDVEIHITTPLEKARDIKITSKDSFVLPTSDDKIFDIATLKHIEIDGEKYNYDFALKLDSKNAKTKVVVVVPKHEKIQLDSEVEYIDNGDTDKVNGQVNLAYGQGKRFNAKLGAEKIEGKQLTLDADVTLPEGGKLKRAIAHYIIKKLGENSYSTDLTGDIDGKKYVYGSSVQYDKTGNGKFELTRQSPDKKPAKILLQSQKVSETEMKGTGKVENLGDFNLDLDVDANVIANDHWNVKIDVDCPKLKLNKILFKASNEAPKTGNKKVGFSATENNNNILTGEVSYQGKQEGEKYIVEGSGTVKYKNEENPITVKYIRGHLDSGNEHGAEVFFTVEVGGRRALIEYKHTNLEFKVYELVCSADKKCSHIDINQKLDTSVAEKLTNNFKFGFDLRNLGFAPEFGVKSTTELQRFHLPVHTLDIYLNQDASKYHTQVYAKPNKGAYQSAVTLTTPSRVIALESSTTYPENIGKDSFKPYFQHETAFYPNKQGNPSSKTVFKVLYDATKFDESHLNTIGEISFTSPAIGKDLKIATKTQANLKNGAYSGETVLDIFRKPNQKIVATVTLTPVVDDKSFNWKAESSIDAKGLGIGVKTNQELSVSSEKFKYEGRIKGNFEKQEREGYAIIDLTKEHQKIELVHPVSPVINLNNKLTTGGDHLVTFDTEVVLLKDLSYKLSGVVNNKSPYGFKLSGGNTNTGKTLKVNSVVDLTNKAEISTSINDKNLATAGLYVEDKLIVPKLKIGTENFKEVQESVVSDLKTINGKVKAIGKQISEIVQKNSNRANEIFKDALPDYDKFIQPYVKELNAFEQELEKDKAAQDITKAIKTVVVPALKVVSDVIDQVSVVLQKSSEFGTEVFNRLNQLVHNQIIPDLTEFFKKIYSLGSELFEASIDLVSHYLAIAADFIDKHIKPFEPIFKDAIASLKDLNKAIVEELTVLKAQLAEFLEKIQENIESLPIVEMIKDTADDYNVKEKALEVITEVLEAIKIVVPHDGFQDFVDGIISYITKKAQGEKVNDIEEIKQLAGKLQAIVKGLTQSAEAQIKTPSGFGNIRVATPTNWLNLISQFNDPKLPNFSLLNIIENDDYPSIEELIESYWPRSLNPIDYIPPNKLQGQVVDGSHFFTYDGRHLTFLGNCRYVLSQDAVDGNFSVVLQVEAGQPKSITLVDKSGSAVEVNTKGELKQNGAAYGFPVWKADTYAWKTKDTFTLATKYGAMVQCNIGLNICKVQLSGYYTGKVRGLLGDGNNEPYDDFRLPNGKVVTSGTEFGNAYALTTCPPGVEQGHDHSGKGNSYCTSFFEDEITQSFCENSIKKTDYITACKHASLDPRYGQDSKRPACLMAKAYALACRNAGFFVKYPETCDTCEVDGKKYNIGDQFEVKLPQKEADIILAVETTTENKKNFKELAVPLVQSIIEELKTKKITDVKINLIGLSPQMPYPIYHDVESNKVKGTEITFKDEQRTAKAEFPVVTENAELDKFLNNARDALRKAIAVSGLSNIQLSYNMLSHYQLRPKAVKTLIMVHSAPCSNSPLVWLSNTYNSLMLNVESVTAHLIAPITDLKVANVENVIGFNEDRVLPLGNAKGISKKELKGEGLTYTNSDGCAIFAESTDGNVYSSDIFFKLNPNQRKTYLQSASHSIVDGLVNKPTTNTCTCRQNLSLIGSRVSCMVTSKKSANKKAVKK